ncbi:molybdate ABC transporter substrate-binding protein [Allosaccharopolyspora coralli]|uniref:Molybdate ABC transporter substrate-binding protein n=1 Tax=Allosaccharopolyspora coralli TaxID=2665642 RepID=A0A5Q3Q504_9PSEU|nr:molybdate ABC transporter substrate-binding protein [Allosaccharopolyspora coralli]QGK68566.1 molybdate ABC transporter substrate-binding protein [Allosaccharopolyspora coralli]
MRWISRITAAAAVLVLGASCGQGRQGADSGAEGGERELTVLAAASLTDPFEEVAARFSEQNPGVRVRFDFQGSSTLAEQIIQGRPADVFASANEKNMTKVVDADAATGKAEPFVTNRLTIAVPPGNPAGIRSLADLAAPGKAVVTCADPVPCGAATNEVEQASGVRLNPVSEENDVTSVLQKVQAGEADAGLVYVTDVRSAQGRVEGIDFPESRQALNIYPITTLQDAAQPELAAEFVRFVQGPEGREVLERAGFGAP